MINAPGGATHFRIITSGIEINFEEETYVVSTANDQVTLLDNTMTAQIDLMSAVTAGSTSPLFLALGVEFYQMVNGIEYPLKNGSFNAFSIVKVDGN